MSQAWQSIIGGTTRASASDRVIQIIDPATDEVLGQVVHASAEDAVAAVESSRQAFEVYRRTSPAERASMLFVLADVVERSADELATAESMNVGMPLTFARATIQASVDTIRFFAGAARVQLGPSAGEYVRGMTSTFRREPVGVVSAFIPWNVPLLMAIWKIAPALAAGNTVIVKPSIRTPASLLLMLEHLGDAIPTGVINCVTGDHATIAPVLAGHPDVAMVALTGSLEAGAAIGALAAPTAKRLHLELGGKTPVLVCDDADVEAAATTIVRAGLDNAGQDCTAASRVLVDHKVHDALVRAMAERLGHVVTGDPLAAATELGPVVGRDRRTWLCEVVEQAEREGAQLVAGGSPIKGPGAFLQPALLDHVDGSSTIARTELFGPVITVEAYSSPQEMIASANSGRYALAAGIWTQSVGRAMSLAAEIDAGKVWVNEHHRDVTEMPHGGRRGSGHGSDLSILALEAYSTPKAVHISMDMEDR